jgi:Apea-like HEPN
VFTLEILFGSGSADSIKYKILIRMIDLLSDGKENRHILYDKMNILYTTRSSIVHGLDYDKTKIHEMDMTLTNWKN